VAKSSLKSKLSFKIPGTISKIAVQVGDVVKKGDLIATLDQESFQLKEQEAAAGLEQAKAQLVNASSNYRRVQRLYESDSASKSDLDTSRAAFDSASAMVRSIEKKLELARLQLRYTILTAPFGGAVSFVNADVNENIGAGNPVVNLSSSESIEVTVAISELLISAVHGGESVHVSFDAIPGKIFKGAITEVGVATSRFATTYPVTVALDGDTGAIKPGMVGQVQFTFGSENQKTLIVPSHSVVEDSTGRFVYVAIPVENKSTDKNDETKLATVRKKPVVTGELVAEGMEIIEGLAEGEFVVTAGISKLFDGMEVKLLSKENGTKG
jgi:RND family efflux transporter MFP subunit